MVKVRELMTGYAAACPADIRLPELERTLLRQDRGPFSVVDRRGNVVGMLTRRDILTASTRLGRPASLISAREAISDPVPPCHVSDDISVALSTMKSKRLRRLAVVDATSRLVGAVCVSDPRLEEEVGSSERRRDPHTSLVRRSLNG